MDKQCVRERGRGRRHGGRESEREALQRQRERQIGKYFSCMPEKLFPTCKRVRERREREGDAMRREVALKD